MIKEKVKKIRSFLKKDFDPNKPLPPYNEVLAAKLVCNLISPLTDYQEILTGNESLKDDLGLDSLDIIELCMKIEGELNVSIDDDIIPTWKTVNDIIVTVKDFYLKS